LAKLLRSLNARPVMLMTSVSVAESSVLTASRLLVSL
jgi:amino acid permease